MKRKNLKRELPFIGFKDCYGGVCSIQESSTANDNRRIWLGVDDEPRRMLLNRNLVRQLLPLLQHFVETGYLPE